MKYNTIISFIFLCFASGIKAQNNITDTAFKEGVNVCMSFKKCGYNNFTFNHTDQNTKYYRTKNKIDNSEVEIMSRIDKTQIMKQCFELILSGNIKKTYSNGIISNPYKPISEFKRRRHNI